MNSNLQLVKILTDLTWLLLVCQEAQVWNQEVFSQLHSTLFPSSCGLDKRFSMELYRGLEENLPSRYPLFC